MPLRDADAAAAGRAFARRAAVLGSAVSIGIGATYLAAWWLGLPPRWAATGVIVMKTNMALAQVLAGASLLLLRGGRTTRGRLAVAQAAAGVVLLIGILTLAEYALRVDLRIDQLLATEPPGVLQTPAPNRMGLPGATSLALIGAGLLALARRRRVHAWLGSATCFVVLVAAVGFVYRIGQLYANPQGAVIAWPSVVALLALGLGIALADPRDGSVPLLWRADAGGALLRRLLAPAALVPLAIGFVRLAGERRGLYERHVGTGLFAVSASFFCLLLVWRSAARVSASAAERDRAEDRARWRASLLDLSHDAVLIWSRARGIESWNHGAEALYGFSADEAIGRVSHELLGTRFPRPWSEIEAELGRTGRWEGDLVHRTRAGDDVVVLSAMQVVRGTDGAVRVLESNRDISDRRRAEEALRRANELLRDADRRKDEFLGMLSHELRNPLAPIRNALFVLARADAASPEAGRAKDIAARQVAHLTELVDDLLDVTRIARGKIELRRSDLDVAALTRQVAEDARAVLDERGVALAVDAPAEPLVVSGDETRLVQVLGNLLHNAAKFTPGGGRVTVAVRAEPGFAAVSVRDTGAGIARDVLQAIFEPFTQAKQTLARTEGGLGLGLALVKGIVELHGGTVSASSEGPGRGSEFTVRIPLAPDARAPAEGPAEAAGRWPGRHRVLVVDDNVDAADTLAELVRMLGHDVEVAYDGASAIERVDAAPPDVVLCDIGLPGIDGYEVARAVRGRRDGRVRLVAVSGYAQPEDVRRAVEAGFDAHVAKPPDPARLEQLLATRAAPGE